MSQYGAQGWATGAAGPKLTGEQIVGRYYAGTTVGIAAPPGGGIRVLLSAPSSQGRYNCSGTAFMSTWLANVSNPAGFKVLNEGAGNREIGRANANQPWQIAARNGIVQVWNNGVNPPVKIYEGAGPIVTVPIVTSGITKLAEKGFYRGNLRFTNLGNTLRAINYLSYDDYLRGVVPLEMPAGWHPEAYKAQALAARSYAFTSYKGGSRDYDVSDDQADQCYGGVQLLNGRVVESAETKVAIDATLGKVILHNGQAIRAYFSSSSGGYTRPFGCWGATVTRCQESPSYLTAVPDPADVLVSSPANRHANWTATYTSAQIRSVVANMRGIDIGTLLAVDLSNRSPGDVGHAVSIVISGSNASVELPAEGFFRGQLGLKSTMVRLTAW
jgi:stage II sporulation protein D